MRSSKIAIIALVATLVLSNAAWVYVTLDNGVRYSYLDDSYRTVRATANQAMKLLPIVARTDLTKDRFVAAAERAGGSEEPFEKDGFVWVGNLGLRFESNGVLAEVRANTESF